MHKQKAKILLAEDDLNLGILLLDFLETEGFEVRLCKDGDIASDCFSNSEFDLCILDVMMPKKDGFTLATEIRATDPLIPIIFITAKSLKEDKWKGYDIGADDYITKPFDVDELLWKIKAILRRFPEQSLSNNSIPVYVGKYMFDFKNQSLILNGTCKRITEKESEILNYFVNHPNSIIKREVMLKELWGDNDYFMGRSLDVFITKIRKYLKDDPNINIENVFGVGFIFNVPIN